MNQGFGSLLDKWHTLQLIIADPRVSSGAANLFARLAWHLNGQTGQCNPSQQTLSNALGLSTRTIRSHSRELEAAGYLKTWAGRNGASQNHYSLMLFKGDDKAYRQAENMCLQRRKKSSDKHMKEHLKGKRAKKKRTQPIALCGAASDSACVDEVRKSLERRVLSKFQSSAEGWSALMQISEDVYLSILGKIGDGQITERAAVHEVLKAISRESARKL